jgi:fructose PTS system EIIA component
MSDLINKNLVNLNLISTTRDEAIKELAKLIDAEGRLTSYDMYIDEVFDRESKTSTGIGLGIAIPHGKCDAVKIPTVAFGRSSEGILWDSLDGGPVKVIFLLAVPNEGGSGNEHLRILAAISRKLLHDEFNSRLYTVETEEELVELLSTAI